MTAVSRPAPLSAASRLLWHALVTGPTTPPPSRELRARLGLSRRQYAAAWRELRAAGLVRSDEATRSTSVHGPEGVRTWRAEA